MIILFIIHFIQTKWKLQKIQSKDMKHKTKNHKNHQTKIAGRITSEKKK